MIRKEAKAPADDSAFAVCCPPAPLRCTSPSTLHSSLRRVFLSPTPLTRPSHMHAHVSSVIICTVLVLVLQCTGIHSSTSTAHCHSSVCRSLILLHLFRVADWIATGAFLRCSAARFAAGLSELQMGMRVPVFGSTIYFACMQVLQLGNRNGRREYKYRWPVSSNYKQTEFGALLRAIGSVNVPPSFRQCHN